MLLWSGLPPGNTLRACATQDATRPARPTAGPTKLYNSESTAGGVSVGIDVAESDRNRDLSKGRSRSGWRILALAALTGSALSAQPAGFNYDESKVPPYQLPEILRFEDGTAVSTPEQWRLRRAEIVRLFEEQVYGTAPGTPEGMHFTLVEEAEALGGLARRRQVRIDFAEGGGGPRMEVLLYVPAGADGPVPVFAGLNFGGNHTVNADPGIRMAPGWMREGDGVVDNRATPATRGRSAGRWQIERILRRGYGLATAYCVFIFKVIIIESVH